MLRLHWEQLSPTENSKTATSEMLRLHWEQLSPTENSKTVRNVEASLGTTITYRKQ